MRKSDRKYCSLACLHRYPPKMLEAEREYGAPMEDLLLRWLNDGMSIEAVAGLCGVHRQAVHAWMRVLGIRREVRFVRRGAI